MRTTAIVLTLICAGCAGACDFRCHTQHRLVTYHAAYTSHHSTCASHDKNGNCTLRIPYTVNHPERCSVSVECDIRCKVVDSGRSEAHPDHPPFVTDPVVAPRCTVDGDLR